MNNARDKIIEYYKRIRYESFLKRNKRSRLRRKD